MIDVAAIKQQTDLLSLVGQDVTLRRHASTRGGEYVGPCPLCKSGHRIHVQPATGLWFCRICFPDGRWRSAIDYVMMRDRVDFLEACRRLGANPQPDGKAAKLSLPEIPEDTEPLDTWRAKVVAIVADCEARLWTEEGAKALDWLRNRGFNDGTLRSWRLGFNPAKRERMLADGETQRGRYVEGLWVCHGITIPGIAFDGLPWLVNVRRPVQDHTKRYRAVGGSRKKAMLGRPTGKADLLLVEGELDMMLAWQEAGDLVDVATFGSCNVQPSGRWLPYLASYARQWICYDLDPSGQEGAGKWAWSARSKRLRLPLLEGEGKDLGDFVKAGGNLRAWLDLALATPEPEVGSEPEPDYEEVLL